MQEGYGGTLELEDAERLIEMIEAVKQSYL
jgi:hypothetical protein